jgi:hypothetical protein
MTFQTKSASTVARAKPQLFRASLRESFSKLDDNVLLSEQECAEICGFAVVTLKKWRLAKSGDGPETTPSKRSTTKPRQGPKATYIHGSIRYRTADVRAWLKTFSSDAA